MRGRSISPGRQQQQQQQQASGQHNNTTTVTETITKIGEDGSKVTTTIRSTSTKPVSHRNLDNEEPIRLSKLPGGYVPDPQTPCKIDTLDWPAPPYPAAVPELRARSRSSSNRRAPSTITSLKHETIDEATGQPTTTTTIVENRATDEDSDDSDDEDLDNEVKQHLLQAQLDDPVAYQQYVMAHRGLLSAGAGAGRSYYGGASSVSSSIARAKSTRPNSKFRYQNNLFDNDYNDYLLRYKSNKEFRKLLEKTRGTGTGNSSQKRYHSGGETSEENDMNNNNENEEDKNDEDDDDEFTSPAAKQLEAKIKKEIAEISKIEKESSMAAAVLQELKVI